MQQSSEEHSAINALLVKGYRWLRGRLRRTTLLLSLSPSCAYLAAAVFVLAVSTVFWSFLGARLQLHNADQLSDVYMFSNWHTFHTAFFPGAHTFLIKWPIFALLGLVGISAASVTIATMAVVVITVGALAWLLYRIERRPMILGTVYIALAFVLLLVPPQPYAGGILPVNMAMLTTRNIEYVAYIASLVLFVRTRRLRSWAYASAIALLGLLIASDKLFIGLSAGGALLALVAYAVLSNWRMVTFAVRWLVGTGVAVVVAAGLLGIVSGLHITHLVGDSAITPYGLGGGAKNLVQGAAYGVLGLLTNVGANPAFDNRTLATLPHDMLHQLAHLGGILSLLAALLALVALAGVWYVVRPHLSRFANQQHELARADVLSSALVWSTVAALGIFVVAQHYYPVDARYLTIGMLAALVAVTTALRSFQLQRPNRMTLIGLGLAVGVAAGMVNMQQVVAHQNSAYSSAASRDATIVKLLQQHKVDAVLGDYWRMLPLKLAAHNQLQVMPLSACTQPAKVLTSGAWQPDLAKHSFAYLITLDGSLTNYPKCSLAQISGVYGRPNAVQVVAGTLAAPKEALLFYDKGSHPPVVTSPAPISQSILPISTDQLVKTSCTQPTIMNVVAHQDDDLLFLSPDLIHELQTGDCVRTVYLTAGDGGFGKFYWISRQLGAEAAYSTMLGIPNLWDHQTLVLPSGQYVTVANPRNNSQVSLLFVNLPDGNLHGEGFSDSDNQSLQKLQAGSIAHMRTIDGQSVYTAPQLTAALTTLMDTYQPTEIHTQATVVSSNYPDHSDHMATSRFTDEAAAAYDQQHFGGGVTIPVSHYIGYPVRDRSPNVGDGDLALKQAAFFAYAHYDGGVCSSIERCAMTPTYNAYLSHQYRQEDGN